MKKIASFVTILTLSSTAFATQVKVIKTGGNRAVIEFPKGTAMKAGESLNLSSGDAMEADSGGGGGGGGAAPMGGRKNSIDLTSKFTLASGNFSMSPILGITYGMNMGMMELAVGAEFSKPAVGDFSFGFVGGLDVNFTENKVGATFVPAAVLRLSYAHSGTNLMGVSGGLAGKIFVLRQSQTAIRLEALFNFSKIADATSTSFTVLGVGLQTYF